MAGADSVRDAPRLITYIVCDIIPKSIRLVRGAEPEPMDVVLDGAKIKADESPEVADLGGRITLLQLKSHVYPVENVSGLLQEEDSIERSLDRHAKLQRAICASIDVDGVDRAAVGDENFVTVRVPGHVRIDLIEVGAVFETISIYGA